MSEQATSLGDGFGWGDVKNLLGGAVKLAAETRIEEQRIKNAANAQTGISQQAAPVQTNGEPVKSQGLQSTVTKQVLLYGGMGAAAIGGALVIAKLLSSK